MRCDRLLGAAARADDRHTGRDTCSPEHVQSANARFAPHRLEPYDRLDGARRYPLVSEALRKRAGSLAVCIALLLPLRSELGNHAGVEPTR
jgi:hypothetical protein